MEKRLKVGVVTSSHGLQGEVKVFPMTDDPARFKDLQEALLDTGAGMRPLKVERVRFFKQMVILKFAGIERIEEAEGLRGRDLYVTRENAVKLAENEYFIADLIGVRVYEEEGAYLGELTEVLSTGANDVYVVKRESGKEVLIPAIRQCIRSVDVEQGEMRVHLLEGLLDL